jgi:hypothetical protein
MTEQQRKEQQRSSALPAELIGAKSLFAGMGVMELLCELEDLYWHLEEFDGVNADGDNGIPDEVSEALAILGSLY